MIRDGSPDVRRRAQFTLAVIAIVFTVTLVRGTILLAKGVAVQGTVALTAATLACGLALLLRHTGSLFLVGNLLAAVFFFALASLIHQRGGVGSPPTVALGLIPLVTVLTAGWRSGLAWATVTIALLVAFTVVGPLPDAFPAQERPILSLLGASAVVAISVAIASAYEATKDAALQARDDADRRRRELSVEHEQLSADLDRAEREARQEQHDRLAAVGELAAGVAHDFNNLLTAILNSAELAELELPAHADEARDHLSHILAAGTRAADLTRRLLSFGSGHPTQREPLELPALVEGMLAMLRRLVPHDIVLEYESPNELPSVVADRVQMEQLLMNLCLNARDAMPDGGELRVRTTMVTLTEADAARRSLRPGDYVQLDVADPGVGMDESVRARIFEPFFSTKGRTRGSGLGLSMVYGIVQRHGGAIEVESAPGRGTTFSVLLPVSQERPDTSSAVDTDSLPRAMASAGTRTILVADDEPAVLQLMTRALALAEFEVLAATDGAEAIALFQRRAGDIHLVVLDAIMPHVGGRDVHDRIVAMRPDMPFVFVSGYADSQFPTGFFDGTHRAFLHKPFRIKELLATVEQLIGVSHAP